MISCLKKGILLFLLSFSITSKGQTLKFVHFSMQAELLSYSFITDQKIVIKISPTGKVMEWGNEQEAGRFYNQPGALQSYMGRVEYYKNNPDSVLNGKVKSIGTATITYYGSFDNPSLVGKVKTIGTVSFDYFADYENELLRGKIKKLGSKEVAYYSAFENEAYRGRVKSVGSTAISYYSTFEDKALRGKLKNIGNINYTWYTSSERFAGSLKSGPLNPIIESITFIMR